MKPSDSFHVYDTTLRDGAQREGMACRSHDKLTVAAPPRRPRRRLHRGRLARRQPKDTEFFSRRQTELELQHATLAAFGSTRKADAKAADDPQVAALRDSGAPVVTLVAKSRCPARRARPCARPWRRTSR